MTQIKNKTQNVGSADLGQADLLVIKKFAERLGEINIDRDKHNI